MRSVGDMKDKLNGWQIVALVALVLGALVGLVAMGQQFGALIAGVVAILSLLGYNTAQNKTNNDLANGRLTALQDQLARKDKDHADDMSRLLAQAALERSTLQMQLKDAHDKAAAYAAQVTPDAKAE